MKERGHLPWGRDFPTSRGLLPDPDPEGNGNLESLPPPLAVRQTQTEVRELQHEARTTATEGTITAELSKRCPSSGGESNEPEGGIAVVGGKDFSLLQMLIF